MPLATPQGTLDFKSVDTITFVGASSNTVIDTTTGSFGVGVDANGPTSNLHVVGDALITGNVAVDTNTLFVDSVNDRVGVGTATPTTALDVVGTVTATAFAGNASTASALAASVNIGGVAFDGSAAIVPTTFTTATFSGDVGIGTTSPIGNLSVVRDTVVADSSTFQRGMFYKDGKLQITPPDLYSGYPLNGDFLTTTRYKTDGTTDFTGAAIGVDYTTTGSFGSSLYFKTASSASSLTEKVRITDTGNVGIGTTDPLARLDVQAAPRTGSTTGGAGIYVTGDTNEYIGGSEFRHSNQTQGVGIGYAGIYATGSNTDQNLYIISRGTGSTFVKNYVVFSDDRIKTNEEYITNATETLMKLKPQVYDKHEKINVLSDNPKREAGLIAQDIYYDTPELRYIVSTRNEGIDAEHVNIPSEKPFVDDDPQKDPDYSGWGTGSAGVAYIQLVPYLIKSNQEIYTELQAEKARNDSLEARILALENA
jgi:hypothetical protein